MPDPDKWAERFRVYSRWGFVLGWTGLFLISGHVLGRALPITHVLIGGVAASVVAVIGLFPGENYFALRNPKAWVRASRRAGIVWVRHWVVDGDKMNASIRARVPGYRVIKSDPPSIEAYVGRTRDMERVHLACFLSSLVVLGLALSGSLGSFAAAWLAITVMTNALPIALQRYNRARCELVIKRRASAPNPGDRRATFRTEFVPTPGSPARRG